MGDFTSVWDEAGYSAETEAAQRALANAKIASASIWPFLAVAQDPAEFGQRLDLAGDTLVAAASAHGVEVADLVAAYTREYGLLAESRKTAGELPDALKEHQFKSADEQDEEEGETDQQKESARHTATDDDVLHGELAHSDQSFFNSQREDDYRGDNERTDTSQWRPESAEKALEHKNTHGSRRTAGAAGGGGDVTPEGYHYPESGAEGDDNEDNDETDERTADEKYRDAGNYYKEDTPGDITDKYYDKLSMIKKSLDEGEDPLDWVAEVGGGQGAPEKPIEHDTDVDYTNSYSEVPPGAPGQGQSATGSRHPFASRSRHPFA